MTAMLYSRSKLLQGGAIASEFIGDDHPRLTKCLESFAEEPNGGPLIEPRLHEDVQHIVFAVDSAPQPILLTIYPKDDFVQVPFVRHFRSISADRLGILQPAFRNPSADGLVADHNTACGQQILNIAQTHGKSMIGLDGVCDNLRWETVA
jgi:hypothetical protein